MKVSISISVTRETGAVTDNTFIINSHGSRDASYMKKLRNTFDLVEKATAY